ncbi:hypothetical protein [Aliikangiella maris]|uniref:Uncharacterized protein n=2 Tax=Aliikangiella maris TaxID=3162458 RepID=A0ABV3MS98_9GAMM
MFNRWFQQKKSLQTNLRLKKLGKFYLGVCFSFCFLQVGGIAHAEIPYDRKIKPHAIDSQGIGSVDSSPYLQVNEFNGGVSGTLPAIGINGFALTPTYNSPLKRRDNIERYDDNAGNIGELGVGWHLGLGHIVVVPRHIIDSCGHFQSGAPEKIYFVDSAGKSSKFAREQIGLGLNPESTQGNFNVPGDIRIHRDSNPSAPVLRISKQRDLKYIDTSGRILTRQAADDNAWRNQQPGSSVPPNSPIYTCWGVRDAQHPNPNWDLVLPNDGIARVDSASNKTFYEEYGWFDFVLMQPDGGKIYYTATKDSLDIAWQHLIGQETAEPNAVHFYPTKIVNANGVSYTLTYAEPAELYGINKQSRFNGGEKQNDTLWSGLEDSGMGEGESLNACNVYSHCIASRYIKSASIDNGPNPESLTFFYEEVGGRRPLLREVRDSRFNRLAYFDYQLSQFDDEYHLSAYTNAANQRITIALEDLGISSAPVEKIQNHPWIRSITSPKGATTHLIYQLVNIPGASYFSGSGRPGLCDDPDATNGDLPPVSSCDWAHLRSNSAQKRVKNFVHSGATYTYTYLLEDNANKAYDLLSGIATVYAPSSLLKVTMKATGEQDIERITYYADYQSESYRSYPRALSKIIGKPIFKETTFHNGNSQNANSVVTEEWQWRAAPLEALGGEAPFQSQRPQLISAAPVVARHAIRIQSPNYISLPDGAISDPIKVTEFDYQWDHIQMLVANTTSYIKQQANRAYVVRKFSYRDSAINKTPTVDGAWTQYQSALPSESKECLIENSSALPKDCIANSSQRLGHVAFEYEQAIAGNTNLFLTNKYIAKDETDLTLSDYTNKLVQTLTYHQSGSDKGYLHTTSNGSLTTAYEAYENGEATRVYAPDGSQVSKNRQLIWGAVIDEVVEGGVNKLSKHDLVGRPLESQQGSDSAIYTSYPSVTKTQITRDGVQLSETSTDLWGRIVKNESTIDPGIINTDRTQYSNLGVSRVVTNTNGAKVITFADISGRPLHIKFQDSSNRILKEEFFTYGFIPQSGMTYTHHQVKTHDVPSAGYIASESYRILYTDILGRNRKAIPCVIENGNSECAELLVEIDYSETTANGYNGIILAEAKVVTETGTTLSTRKRWTDLIGNLFKEYNPEIGTTRHEYTAENLLRRRWNKDGVMDNYYRYDTGGRLIEIVRPGGAPVFEAQYDAATDLLSWTKTPISAGSNRLVEETYTYDENNRIESKTVNIPTLLGAIENLRPRTLASAPATLNLRWDQVYAGQYKVHLTHNQFGTLAIDADNGVNQVSLTNANLSQKLQQKITAGHANSAAYQQWKNQLAQHPDSPISLDNEYTWKVSAITSEFEPIPSSETSRITSRCNILELSFRRGINQGPLIQWETANCDGLSTEVLARTLPGTGSVDIEPRCMMPPAAGTYVRDGGVFSGLKQGPRRAHWMFNGYNFEDVELAMEPDPDREPTWTGEKQCAPVERAEFQLKVYDANRNIVTQSESIIADWTSSLKACQIRNFYVNNGYTGKGAGVPKVTWETLNCSNDDYVELKISSLDTNQPLECDLSGEVLSNAKQGNIDANIMKSRPSGCDNISAALFELKIRENSDPGSTILDSRDPIIGYIDRNDCHVSYFNVVDGDENNNPKISWQTKNCGLTDKVQVKYDAVQPGVSENCQLRSQIFSTDKSATNAEADFMYTPYQVIDGKPVEPTNGNACDAMKSVDVWVEIVDASGFPLLDKTSEIDLAYTGGLQNSGTSTCKINDFNIQNPTMAGRLPKVIWDTECDHPVQVMVFTNTTHNPANSACRVNRGMWDGHHDMPQGREVYFMVGGYGSTYNCPSVTSADFWIEMRDVEDSTILIAESQVKQATFTPLPNQSGCQVSQLSTSNGQNGQLPTVSWQTLSGSGCSDSNVEVIVKGATTDGHIPVSCQESDFQIGRGVSGSNRSINFMTNCPDMRNGVVWIETYQSGLLIRKSDFKAFTYDPDSGTPPVCEIQSFSVQNSATIGMLPRVYWQTNCGNNVSVQVRTTTIDPANLSNQCAAYKALWDGNKSGNRTVDYMVGGYGPNHNCPRVRRAEFIIELWQQVNGQQVKIASRPPQIARFDPVRSPTCRVAEFSIDNNTGGLPTVTWQVTGSGCGESNVEAKLYWSSTDFSIPSSCRWDKALIAQSSGGAANTMTLSDMDGSSNCPTQQVDSASLWIEIKEGGRLSQRTSYFEARYRP